MFAFSPTSTVIRYGELLMRAVDFNGDVILFHHAVRQYAQTAFGQVYNGKSANQDNSVEWRMSLYID